MAPIESDPPVSRAEPPEAATDAAVLDSSLAGPRSIRGGLLRAIGYVAGLGLVLLSAPLVIRHLGIVEFGRYTTVLSVATIATGLAEGGVTTLGLREYAVLEGEARRNLMRALLGLRLALSTVAIAAGAAFCAVAGYGESLVLGALLAGTGLALVSVQLLASVPLQASLRLGAITGLDLLRQALSVALVVAVIVAGGGVVPLLAVLAVAGVAPLVITAVLVRDSFPLVPSRSTGRWGELLVATVPFAAVSLIAVVYFRLTIVVLSLVSTGEETGYFATGFRVLEAFIGVPALLVTAVFPILARAARDDMARLRYAMERVLQVAVIGGVWLALGVVLGADFIIQVLTGGDAEPAVPALRVQGLALLPSFVGSACGFALLSLHRQRAVVVSIGVGLVVNLVLTLVLAPAHGALGAAVAITTAESTIAVMMLLMLLRAGEGVRFPVRAVLPVLPAALAGAAVALTGLPSLVQAILASAVFFAVLALLRGIPSELFHALRYQDRRSPP